MTPAAEVFLGLGSNLGNRAGLLNSACQALQQLPLSDFQTSSIYESVPYQGADQPLYYNQVARGKTPLSPQELLEACHAIEAKLGRVRQKRWESRPIDIDILYYADLILEFESLTLPHIDLANRGFVLLPLAEIAPHHIDPRWQTPITTLLQRWQTHTQEPHPVLVP